MKLARLLAPDPGQGVHAEELRRTLVEDLYRRSSATVWFLVPLMFLLREIIRSAYDASPAVRWAFWTTLLVVLARWGAVVHHRRHPVQDPDGVRARYRRFHFFTVFMGLGIASIVFFAAGHVSFSQLALLCVLLTGIHSVAMASMAASPRTYLQYINPALVAVIWAIVSRPRGSLENLLLSMIALYVPILSIMSLVLHGGLRRTILLGFELRDLALKDVLTGLPNRRFLTEFMEREAAQILRGWHDDPGAGRTGGAPRSLGLLLIDLDFFKSVNDEHGHAAGDEVLRQLAAVVQDTVRRPDLVVRWGGEEFVIVARDLDRDAVWDLAERIRRRVETHAFLLTSGETLRRTCSIGFSLFPFHGAAPTLLGWGQALTLADHALYQAKDAGRNRAVGVVSGHLPPESAESLLRSVKEDFSGAAAHGRIRVVLETPRPLPVRRS